MHRPGDAAGQQPVPRQETWPRRLPLPHAALSPIRLPPSAPAGSHHPDLALVPNQPRWAVGRPGPATAVPASQAGKAAVQGAGRRPLAQI